MYLYILIYKIYLSMYHLLMIFITCLVVYLSEVKATKFLAYWAITIFENEKFQTFFSCADIFYKLMTEKTFSKVYSKI